MRLIQKGIPEKASSPAFRSTRRLWLPLLVLSWFLTLLIPIGSGAFSAKADERHLMGSRLTSSPLILPGGASLIRPVRFSSQTGQDMGRSTQLVLGHSESIPFDLQIETDEVLDEVEEDRTSPCHPLFLEFGLPDHDFSWISLSLNSRMLANARLFPAPLRL